MKNKKIIDQLIEELKIVGKQIKANGITPEIQTHLVAIATKLGGLK